MFKGKLIIIPILSVLLLLALGGVNASFAQACVDGDGDDYGAEGTDLSNCQGSTIDADCDDTDPDVNPGEIEICDGVDTNCDGYKHYTDVDVDGDGVPWCANDCDDNNPDAFPGNPEICDGIDNDCNYVIPMNERDFDGDGFFPCEGDCDDSDPYLFPGALEECDFKDNDCNGVVDDACVCVDSDNDGQLPDHPTCGGQDCDNTDPEVFLGAPEICTDGKDNDCDGIIDIQDPDAVNCNPACVDNDDDTYYVDSSSSGVDCGIEDCDDTDPTVNPGAPVEVCDGKDTDCDGWRPYTDVDVDGDGYALCANDCDDSNPDINPGMLERTIDDDICNDGIDNDCDIFVDAVDPGCRAPSCVTKSSPKEGPHFFTLLDENDNIHPDNASLNCGKCHGLTLGDQIRVACQRCHADSSDPSNPLNGIIKDQYPLDPPYGYGTAPNVSMHSSETVGNKYGNWTMGEKGCVVCHNPHAQEQNNIFGTTYGMYIKEYICYDNDDTGQSFEEFVEFTSPTGMGSFADGPPHPENVCEMCHTRPNHHQRDGTAPGGQEHFTSEKCTSCHLHEDGFLPTGGEATSPHNTDYFNSNCQVCHIETEGVFDFSAPVPDEKCQGCHGERNSHTSDPSRNEFGPNPNYNTYDIKCVDCHNPMFEVDGNRKLIRPVIDFTRADNSNVSDSTIVNTTIRGTGSLGDSAPHNENICESCHSQTDHNTYLIGGNHDDGVDRTSSYCMVCHDHNKSFMEPGKTCLEENIPGINCGQ